MTMLERDVHNLRALYDLVHAIDKKLDVLVEATADMPELKASVKSLEMTRAEAKGGWSVITMIAGASAAAGGVVTWLFNHFSGSGTLKP